MLASFVVGKRLAALLVSLFVTMSVASMFMWRSEGLHSITGDEPHYLVIADGLLPTFELEQTGPYSREFQNRTIYPAGLAPRDATPIPDNTHAEIGPRGLFNVHNIGLPLLLAVPYLFGGEMGARLAMIAMAALVVILLVRLVATTNLSPTRQFLTVLPLVVALPFATGGTQIYPDMPAGVIILSAITLLFRPHDRERRWIPLAIAVAVAYLPWLHIRFGLPMVLLLAALWWVHSRKGDWRRSALLFGAPALVSLLLLAGYNIYAFGNPSGPYSSGDIMFNRMAIMQFFGLFFDQNQGMFIQQPLHFVGVYYLVRLARERALATLTTVAVMLSVLIPNSTHWNLYGGLSFNGRFGWAASTAFLAITVLGFAKLWASSQRATLVVLTVGVLVQIRHIIAVFIQKRVMLPHTFDGWIGTYSVFWRDLETVLPHWRDYRWAFSYFPNFAILTMFLVLLSVGALTSLTTRQRRNVLLTIGSPMIVGLFLSASFADLPYPKMTWPGTGLTSTMGKTDNLSRVASAGDPAGVFTYGPYWRVPPGNYEATINFATSSSQSGAVDVYMPKSAQVLTSVELPDSSGRESTSTLSITVTEEVWGEMEIRTFYKGLGELRVNWISLRRTGDNVAE